MLLLSPREGESNSQQGSLSIIPPMTSSLHIKKHQPKHKKTISSQIEQTSQIQSLDQYTLPYFSSTRVRKEGGGSNRSIGQFQTKQGIKTIINHQYIQQLSDSNKNLVQNTGSPSTSNLNFKQKSPMETLQYLLKPDDPQHSNSTLKAPSVTSSNNQFLFFNPQKDKSIDPPSDFQPSHRRIPTQSLKIDTQESSNVPPENSCINFNFSRKGSFHALQPMNKSSLTSPKSQGNSVFIQTGQLSNKNKKPFYHPFSNQNTTNRDDQTLSNQLFITNLCKFQPNSVISTRKSQPLPYLLTFTQTPKQTNIGNTLKEEQQDNSLNQLTTNNLINNLSSLPLSSKSKHKQSQSSDFKQSQISQQEIKQENVNFPISNPYQNQPKEDYQKQYQDAYFNESKENRNLLKASSAYFDSKTYLLSSKQKLSKKRDPLFAYQLSTSSHRHQLPHHSHNLSRNNSTSLDKNNNQMNISKETGKEKKQDHKKQLDENIHHNNDGPAKDIEIGSSNSIKLDTSTDNKMQNNNNTQNKENSQQTFSDFPMKVQMKGKAASAAKMVTKLLERNLISDESEVATEKVRLTKFFMDEKISLAEKRACFKDILALYAPERKKYSDHVCQEVYPFLSSLKNYFLKIDNSQHANVKNGIFGRIAKQSSALFSLEAMTSLLFKQRAMHNSKEQNNNEMMNSVVQKLSRFHKNKTLQDKTPYLTEHE